MMTAAFIVGFVLGGAVSTLAIGAWYVGEADMATLRAAKRVLDAWDHDPDPSHNTVWVCAHRAAGAEVYER